MQVNSAWEGLELSMDLCRRIWARKECLAPLCSANSTTNLWHLIQVVFPHKPSTLCFPVSLLHRRGAWALSGIPQHSPLALGNPQRSLSLGEPGPLRGWDKALGWWDKAHGVLGKMGGKALSWGRQTSSQPHTTTGEIPPWRRCRRLQDRVVLKEHEISPSSSSLQVWQ